MMTTGPLIVDRLPTLDRPTLLLAFSGWMDGGDVSTGTLKLLLETLDAKPFARIEPEGFYIYNFPASMEVAALFRPHVRYEKAMIESFDLPENIFYYSAERNLVLFLGKEPNLNWGTFSDRIFEMAQRLNVARAFFIGSFGGSVPHTREPRLYAAVSDAALMDLLDRYALRPTEYEGPASFATYLLHHAPRHDLPMASLIAEIPGYLHGPNPFSIEAVTRRLSAILELPFDLAKLRSVSDEWESQVTKLVSKDGKLKTHILKLEAEYDKDLLGTVTEDETDAESQEDDTDGDNEVADDDAEEADGGDEDSEDQK